MDWEQIVRQRMADAESDGLAERSSLLGGVAIGLGLVYAGRRIQEGAGDVAGSIRAVAQSIDRVADEFKRLNDSIDIIIELLKNLPQALIEADEVKKFREALSYSVECRVLAGSYLAASSPESIDDVNRLYQDLTGALADIEEFGKRFETASVIATAPMIGLHLMLFRALRIKGRVGGKYPANEFLNRYLERVGDGIAEATVYRANANVYPTAGHVYDTNDASRTPTRFLRIDMPFRSGYSDDGTSLISRYSVRNVGAGWKLYTLSRLDPLGKVMTPMRWDWVSTQNPEAGALMPDPTYGGFPGNNARAANEFWKESNLDTLVPQRESMLSLYGEGDAKLLEQIRKLK